MALGSTNPDVASSLASRLARLDRRLGTPDRLRLAALAGGLAVSDLVRGLVGALDPDHQEEARQAAGLPAGATPDPEAVAAAEDRLLREALRPLAVNPELRAELIDAGIRYEQTIDEVSQDEVLEAGSSEEARRKAEDLVHSFESFLQAHHDQIVALQVLFSRPYRQRLRYRDVKELAELIEAPPRSWTRERLWGAYEKLRHDKVRGAGDRRLLTDLVSLVRYALTQDDELVPFRERVDERFASWLAQQETRGRQFTTEQREWLQLIRDHVAASLQVEMEDFDSAPFAQRGGAGRAYQVFGLPLDPIPPLD